MSKQKNSDALQFLRLKESLEKDILDGDYPEEWTNEELKKAGFNVQKLEKKGEELAKKLLRKRRLAWMDGAAKKKSILDHALENAKEGASRVLSTFQSGPELQVQFRNRRGESLSEEEKQELVEEEALLEQLPDINEDDE